MLEKTTNKLLSVQCHGLPLLFLRIFVTKRHLTFLCGNNPAVGNGRLMDIPGKIRKDFIGGIAARFTVNNPGFFPDGGWRGDLGKFPTEKRHERCPEDLRQGSDRHQIVSSSMKPVAVIGRQSAGRNETMDMGVISQRTRPGVQNRQHADLSSHIAGICRQFHKRQSCRFHEQGVSDLLVRPNYFMQFFGESKDGMKVRNG